MLSGQLTQKGKSPNYLTWREHNQLTESRWGLLTEEEYFPCGTIPGLILSTLTIRWAKHRWNAMQSAGSEQHIDRSTKTPELLLIFTPMPFCAVISYFFAKKLDSVPLREPPDIWNYMQSCSACRTAPQAFKLQKLFFFFFKLRFSGFLASDWSGSTWRQRLICISDAKRGQVIDSRMCADVCWNKKNPEPVIHSAL